jgi:hypothetical protein
MQLQELGSRRGFLDSVEKTCKEAERVGKVEAPASLQKNGRSMRLTILAESTDDGMRVTIIQPSADSGIRQVIFALLGVPTAIVDLEYTFDYKS